MRWLDETVSELRRLWTVENRSASQIATILACTRNAVIGKAHRLGLLHPGNLRPPASTPRFEPRRPRVKAAIIDNEADAVPENPLPFLGLSIFELGPAQCRYPAEDRWHAPYTFCGQPTGSRDRPYCPFHHARCNVPAPPPRAWPPAYAVGRAR